MKNYSFVQEAIVAEKLGDFMYRANHNLANSTRDARKHTAFLKNVRLQANVGQLHKGGHVDYMPTGIKILPDRNNMLKQLHARKAEKLAGHQRAKYLAQKGLTSWSRNRKPSDDGYW